MFKIRLLALAIFAGIIQVHAGIDGTDADAFFERGAAMFADDNYIGSHDQLCMAMNGLKGLAKNDARLLLALDAMNDGRTALAMQQLDSWLEQNPADARRQDVCMCLGDCCFAGSPATALAYYEKVNPLSLTSSRAESLYYRLGYCYLRTAFYDKAKTCFDRLLKTRYGNQAKFYCGYIELLQGHADAAASILQGIVPGTRAADLGTCLLAQIYYLKHDYDKARSAAQKAADMPGLPDAYRAEANRIVGESLYMTTNSYSAAIPYLRKYRSMVQNPALSALYILGVSEYEDGRYQSAINSLQPVTSDRTAMGQNALVYLGLAQMKAGDNNAAIMAFDRAAHLDFDSRARENALYNYAVAKYGGGNVPFGSSVATFEEFLRLYPQSRYAENVRHYIITGYLTDNNYEAALASIEKTASPSAAVLAAKQQILYTLGTRALGAGAVDKALQYLTQADALKATDVRLEAEIKLALAEALLRDKKPAQALPLLKQYLASAAAADDATNRAVANYDLGYAFFDLRRYEDAMRAFKNFVSAPGALTKNALADAWTRIADCLYYQKEWQQAAGAYMRAYNMNPLSGDYPLFQQAVMKGYGGDFAAKLELLQRLCQEFAQSALLPDAMLEITEAQLQTGDRRGAIATWQKLAEKYPGTAQGRQAYLQMAMTYAEDGDTDRAVATYRTLIAKYPTSDEALQAAENYKRLSVDNGRLQDYVDFMQTVDNAPQVDPAEIDRLAYDAAEEALAEHGNPAMLQQYVKQYPDGAFAQQANVLLMQNANDKGDAATAYGYAWTVTDRWPDCSAAEEAYAIRAAYEYDRGDGRTALESWNQLLQRASTPAMANRARMGIMQIARDLGQADRLLQASEAVLASSTIGAEEKTEAAFSHALAMKLNGNTRQAIAQWQDLAPLTQHLYGAKSAVYLAETLLEQGQPQQSLDAAQALVDAGTPHTYWLARAFITLSDAWRALGNEYQADQYLEALRENYPGTEPDIFNAIEQRLQAN